MYFTLSELVHKKKIRCFITLLASQAGKRTFLPASYVCTLQWYQSQKILGAPTLPCHFIGHAAVRFVHTHSYSSPMYMDEGKWARSGLPLLRFIVGIAPSTWPRNICINPEAKKWEAVEIAIQNWIKTSVDLSLHRYMYRRFGNFYWLRPSLTIATFCWSKGSLIGLCLLCFANRFSGFLWDIWRKWFVLPFLLEWPQSNG